MLWHKQRSAECEPCQVSDFERALRPQFIRVIRVAQSHHPGTVSFCALGRPRLATNRGISPLFANPECTFAAK